MNMIACIVDLIAISRSSHQSFDIMGASSRFRAVCDTVIKHQSFQKQTMKGIEMLTLVATFKRKEAGQRIMVSASLFDSVMNEFGTRNIVAEISTLITHLKEIPETIPSPGDQILMAIEPGIVEPGSNRFSIDYRRIGSRKPSAGHAAYKSIGFRSIRYYIAKRLDGCSPDQVVREVEHN